MFLSTSFSLALLFPLISLSQTAAIPPTESCRCFPGDACWPSATAWSQLNSSVNGRLIATVPLASPCHAPNFDAAVCETLTAAWLTPELHYEDSSSIMAGYFAGNSCTPYTPESTACTLGNLINYAIDVAEPADISEGVKFAAANNIRLIIRNTGHE